MLILLTLIGDLIAPCVLLTARLPTRHVLASPVQYAVVGASSLGAKGGARRASTRVKAA
jgi:hypothetical protein